MRKITDLPLLKLPVPSDLKFKGSWVDNGPLSNMTEGEAVIRFRSVESRYVEPAYVAAKAPDARVPHPMLAGVTIAFHERVALADPRRVKPLGKPRARGGLVDTRTDWEEICVGAMCSFLAQKFAAGTRDAAWLVAQNPTRLVEWTNWGDRRWGAAFRVGQTHAVGHNALGLLQVIGQERLNAGRPWPTAGEAEWKALQLALLPVMVARSAALWGG